MMIRSMMAVFLACVSGQTAAKAVPAIVECK